MIKEFLATQSGMAIFGIVSIIAFMLSFTVSTIRAFFLSDDFANEMAAKALDKEHE
ncbi:hypothetical protein PQO03_08370 [Lentisphaera profundi]|uniref:Uncharacterized protein n=1 Tax=Lentisphaera profundi TaxID=1658616 RepID=A0ABY7VQY2_9BACT|nr:hypothetical protein [Lentisphaera profundi]WDE95729.1 hypothetical protein PQO03_08370 [Lentisphaera profundi]